MEIELTHPRIASVWDLDKTIIAEASMLVFAGTLMKAGLMTRRAAIRAAYGNFIFKKLGANDRRMEKMKRVSLKMTTGWNSHEVAQLIDDNLDSKISPLIYADAVTQIEEDKAAGHYVIIVSSSPIEIVEPIARRLGIDACIATKVVIDDAGLYTGELVLFAYGDDKPVELQRLAEEHNLDLKKSHAYSDSVTDLPLLSCVGHPVAVNPDRALKRHARANGWEIREFSAMQHIPTDTGSRLDSNVTRVSIGVAAISATVGAVMFARRFGRSGKA